jgi:hypothetical protein
VRVLAIFLLTVTAGCAQSDQSQVETVLKQLERAEQTGDFNTWVSLWTREKAAEAEGSRRYATPRPEVHYRPMKSFAYGDEAVILVQAASDSFAVMTFRREGGQWKIQDQLWRDTAPDPTRSTRWHRPVLARLRARDRHGTRSH